MAHNPFGIPPDGGTTPFFNTPGNLARDPDTIHVDPLPGTVFPPDVGGVAPYDLSQPMNIEWEQLFVDISEQDEDYEKYTQMLANDNAAVAAGPEELLDQGLQLGASWQARPATWGPGINGETIPNALLPLYTDIPPYFQTYEYWKLLVTMSRENSFLTPRFWVSQIVRRLAQPTTLPDHLLGWNMVGPEWRMFFLTDRHLFTVKNMTPEIWISMVNHLHVTTPEIWRRELPPALARPEPAERGDPVSYVSQYVPTIQTAAPLLIINPQACGPIPRDYDFTKKPFPGRLINGPHFWGDFFDDGPRKEGEDVALATIRIKCARANMGIIRRPTEKLPVFEKSSVAYTNEKAQKERERLRARVYHANSARDKIHFEMMSETHPSFDPAYRRHWLRQQKERRAENNRRRHAAYEHAARYYRHMGLPVPEKPAPPEESDDENFFDPAEPVAPTRRGANDGRTSEPYRCKPCVEDRGKCNYKSHRFPCRRCVELGRESECVSSRQDLIEKTETRISKEVEAGDISKDHYYLVRRKGPFIPSFALPPERLHHYAFPSNSSLPPPDLTGGIKPKKASAASGSFEDAVKAVKRAIRSAPVDEDEEPKKKRGKAGKAGAGKAGVASGKKNAPVKGTRSIALPIRTRTRRGKKDEKKDKEWFEPCDNCKAIGHVDWCDKGRPCKNCILNERADTCDASRQNQPYTANPGAAESNVSVDDLDDPFNNDTYHSQQLYNFPAQPVPPPLHPINPDEAAPYSYIQEDVERLYESRINLGSLPARRPDLPEDILHAFVNQDRVLRQADANYRPLTLVANVEAYSMELIAAFVNEEPAAAGLGASDLTFMEALWQGGHVSMPSPQTPVTEADLLRDQAQQPHSPSQSMLNFGAGLGLRQTNRHELLTEPSDIGGDGMDWLIDDSPAAGYYNSLHNYQNRESFDATINSIFRDVGPMVDPALVDQNSPIIPPAAQVTTAGIAAALQRNNEFVYPITWYMENIRAGYDVANELATTDRQVRRCTEDLNFWNPGSTQVVPCPSANGIACDAWTCTPNASCPSCWERQKVAASSVEMGVVANTKLWLCRPCKDRLDHERMKPDVPKPMLNRCYCVSQLQETRLCNTDRVAARKAIAEKTAEEAENMENMGWTGRCGHCWSNVEDVTTAAWRCMCCSQIVTLP